MAAPENLTAFQFSDIYLDTRARVFHTYGQKGTFIHNVINLEDRGWGFWREEVKTHDKLIVSDPKVMMGKPIIAGTRITVELILEKLAAGETIQQITEAHPRITDETIRAALSFAAEALKADVLYPVVTEAAA